jgi:hypothetical protein
MVALLRHGWKSAAANLAMSLLQVAAIVPFQKMRMAQNGLMAEGVGTSAQQLVLMYRLSIQL